MEVRDLVSQVVKPVNWLPIDINICILLIQHTAPSILSPVHSAAYVFIEISIVILI